MDYRFKLDVSHLAEKVKKHNLLFYPAMMHILTTLVKRHQKGTETQICTACTVTTPSGKHLKLCNEYHDDFLGFFEIYVYNCYEHMQCEEAEKDDDIPRHAVLISSEPPAQQWAQEGIYPEFYLSAFEEQDGKIWQTVLIKSQQELENPEAFSRECQKMCDMFQERV